MMNLSKKRSSPILWLVVILLFNLMGASCDKDNDDNAISGEAIINGSRVRFSIGYLELSSTQNGDTKNTIILNGNNGSSIEFVFLGENEKTYSPLTSSIPRAIYYSSNGGEYVSYNGTLQVDEYEKKDGSATVSGAYEFRAQSQQGGSDVLITNGVFSGVTEKK